MREEIVKTDLGRLLLKLEALQQARIEAALKKWNPRLRS